MRRRVLVAYSSRTGTTAAIADEIGQVLSAHGLQADVRSIREDPAPAGYSAVVIGSAVRMGSWLWDALDYVRRYQEVLNKVPVAVFTVHALNVGADTGSSRNRAAYLDGLRGYLRPVAEGFFQGTVDWSRLCAFERLTLRDTPLPPAETHTLDKVRAWAQAIPASPGFHSLP